MKRELSFDGPSPLLYLIASPIGNLSEFSPRAKETIGGMDYIACEDTRNTGKLLSCFGLKKPLISCHEHNEEEASDKIISLLKEGKKVAYLSDAGYPSISDPGARLAKKCLGHDIKISVINGPNAAIMALVASGLDTSHFYFYGFLDSKTSARRKELVALKDFPNTIIFYEAPHRIKKTLTDMAEILGEKRQIVLARELTKKHEEFLRGSIEEILQEDEDSLLGEMVIVVSGASKEEEMIDEDKIASLLINKLKTSRPKEAISEISIEYGLPKNAVYDCYLSRVKK